ncbi:MAG: outer membrane beta-barrel protein [Bacteroidota bacterium]
MKRKSLLLYFIIISSICYSQQGTFKVGIGVDMIVPGNSEFRNDFKTGVGGYLKGLYGVGEMGQITFITGYSSLKQKQVLKNTFTSIPLLLGYRFFIKGFYIEPQAGYSINQYKNKTSYAFADHINLPSAFTWAAGIGYEIRNLDIGIHYKSAHLNGQGFSLWEFHMGYNFSLNPGKKE